MTDTTTHSTLISLFHTEEQAQKTLADLQKSGIPQSAIQTIGANGGAESDVLTPIVQKFDSPDRDIRLLSDGLRGGGTVIIVTASGDAAERAEEIFRNHHSHEVDEQVLRDDTSGAVPASSGRAPVNSEGENSIPLVEEELVVGKRAVQGGGVRVISRMRETPVTENVNLREEHAQVERQRVDRPATEADFRTAGQVIEISEMVEEVVVGKQARVVEEIVVDKEAAQHTENVSDTVRRTELEVEPIAADERPARKRGAGSSKEVL